MDIKKIKNYIENNNTFAVIFMTVVLVGGYFLFAMSPQRSANTRDAYKPNDDIVRVADDDPSNALYINNNPKFEVLLGDKENPNKPTVTYISHTSSIPHSLTFSLADSNQKASAPSLETVVSGEGDKKPRLIYRSALDNADINYRIDKGKGVKEEIILKVAPADNGGRDVGFVFDAEFSEGVQVEQGKDGVWYFTDSGGNYLFNFERPFMVDADGVRSDDVAIDIVSVNGVERCDLEEEPCDGKRSFLAEQTQTYQIILKANGPWLFDEARAYPVMIDPSVTHNADSDFTGRFNRVVDADTTSSTQLEIGYQEHGLDPYTVLLIHGNEATGSTVITDMASSTRVITSNGNASTTSATKQPGLNNSMLFYDGDYFSMPDSDDWSFPGDFSIDLWVRWNSSPSEDVAQLLTQDSGGSARGFELKLQGTSPVAFFGMYESDNSTLQSDAGTTVIAQDVWTHIAVITESDTVKMFVNGVEDPGYSLTLTSRSTADAPLWIGRRSIDTRQFVGQLDEIRIIKGRAITTEEIKAAAKRRPYAVYTSQVIDATTNSTWDTLSWTEGGVNTGDGETLFNDASLVAQWNFNETSGTSASDSSANSHTGTLTNMTTSGQDAADGDGWTAENKRWGAGALMFDDGSYVSVPDSDDWYFDADFSIEAWINWTSFAGSDDNTMNIMSQYKTAGGTEKGWQLGVQDVSGDKKIIFNLVKSDGSTNQSDAGSITIDQNTWTHVAVTAESNAVKLWINGIQDPGFSITLDTRNNAAEDLWIGDQNSGTPFRSYIGQMDSLRIYKGRALSAAEILSNYNVGNIEIQTRSGATSDPNDGTWEAWKPVTSETQIESMDSDAANWKATPIIDDDYTKILLHMNGADAATTFPNSATTTHSVTANGNAQVDTAQSKFSGGSALFDGTGDYLSIPDSDDFHFDSGDFTIDAWVRFNALGLNPAFFSVGDDADNKIVLMAHDSNKFQFQWAEGGASTILARGTTVAVANTWYHVAMVRSGSNFNLYVNGILEATGSDSGAIPNYGAAATIGDDLYSAYDMNGWIDELRVSKGIARWTSNFTPPQRQYGSNVVTADESNIKMEGSGSMKLEIGKSQIDGNTVALWHFEETGTTTGTTLYDATANNHDATTTSNPAVVDGIFGKARKFDGVDDYVSMPDSADLSFGNGTTDSPFTVSAWVKTDSSVSATRMIAFKESAGAQEWGFFLRNGKQPTLYLSDDSEAAGFIGRYYDAGLSHNTWHHVVGVYSGNGAVSGVDIYLDGIVVDDTDYTNGSYTAMEDTVEPVRIGGDYYGGGYFSGAIDEVQILDRTLSADEVAEAYRLGANHKISRDITVQDFSASTTMPFWVAGDELGTYLEATIGESAWANYDSVTSSLFSATGGTITFVDGYTIHTFTSDGTFTPNGKGTVEYLVVGGGGGGQGTFGGGGAGGYLADSGFAVTAQGYLITVGSGGAGSGAGAASSGGNSTFSTITADGGGGGAKPGGDGGSGGGGASEATDNEGGTATAGQGNDGGDGHPAGTGNRCGGGGGGASAAGGDGNASTGGAGGAGTASSITGSSVTYAGGGGAGCGDTAGTAGAGGAGGGGAGNNDGTTGTNGTANTGGGGGAAGRQANGDPGTGGTGGSGIVVIRYSNPVHLFLHGDEVASSTSIKDSGISAHTVTANGNAKITGSGKIGNAMIFDGTGDYFTVPDSDDWLFTGDFTFEAWVNFDTSGSNEWIIGNWETTGGSDRAFEFYKDNNDFLRASMRGDGDTVTFISQNSDPNKIPIGEWAYVVWTRDGSNAYLYINGVLVDTDSSASGTVNDSGNPITISGFWQSGASAITNEMDGSLDEVRIIKGTAMSQAEIRQAYEYGARTHPITIDFKASLQPSDLIADSSDTQFAITATTTGLSATTTGLYIGDKIIVKENVSGTEYIAQGTATAINTTTGVVSVAQWDTGSTFPSTEYTPNATVFKWQREYMPLGGIFDTHIDAVERITIRPTNGAGGRTIYLDDFRGSSGFLTASSSEAITSGDNRYFQYRTIYTTADTAVSPYMTSMTVNYTLSANSTPPVLGTSGGGFLSF